MEPLTHHHKQPPATIHASMAQPTTHGASTQEPLGHHRHLARRPLAGAHGSGRRDGARRAGVGWDGAGEGQVGLAVVMAMIYIIGFNGY